MEKHFVIIGGGQAGAMAAAYLRQKGFDGRLTLICDEAVMPYERPPLSKAALLDDDPQLQFILPSDWWQQNKVNIMQQCTVKAIEPQQQRLCLENGTFIDFDKLLITTGACARRFPLLDELGDRAFTLRHHRNAQTLRPHLQNQERIIVVGAGTIGLEVAASARQSGCEVSVIEAAPVLMGRNTPKPVQEFLLDYHQNRGVKFYFNAQIELAESASDVTLTLQDGQQIKGDRVVYGIGIEPNDQLAQQAGLETHNGIIVNNQCQTSNPNIFAAGDVTLCKNAQGQLVRKETWENANQQADIATSAMLEQPFSQPGAGWFWTDQYDLNLQFVGDIHGEHWIIRGDVSTHKAIWFNVVDNQVKGAITLNQGREIRVLRKLIDSGKVVEIPSITDETVALKSLLK